MSDFRHVIEIRVAPARVWSTLLDVEHWPDWTSSVTRLQRLDIGLLTLGSRARIWQPKLRTAIWQVTSFDSARRAFAWTTRSPGVTIVGTHRVDAVGAASRLTLTIQYSGFLSSFLARLYGNLTLDYLQKEATGLKAFCESSAVPAPIASYSRAQ